jgi:hypothetical protein
MLLSSQRPTSESDHPAGAVVVLRGRPFAVLGFTVHGDRIVEIDAIVGAERVARIASAVLN